MQVTDEQRRFFDTFGFCRFRELFKPDEAAAFATALEGALARARDGAAFAGEERQAVVPFIEWDPIFYDLLDDARLMDVVEGLLGEDCLYTGGSDGNYYVGDTRWHADGGVHADNGVMGPFRLAKAAFYLDPVSEGSGCLSVLPGSHDPNYGASISPAPNGKVFSIEVPPTSPGVTQWSQCPAT